MNGRTGGRQGRTRARGQVVVRLGSLCLDSPEAAGCLQQDVLALVVSYVETDLQNNVEKSFQSYPQEEDEEKRSEQ